MVSPKGKRSWVEFRYERSDGLCFSCGRLKHETKTCTLTKPCTRMKNPMEIGLEQVDDKDWPEQISDPKALLHDPLLNPHHIRRRRKALG